MENENTQPQPPPDSKAAAAQLRVKISARCHNLAKDLLNENVASVREYLMVLSLHRIAESLDLLDGRLQRIEESIDLIPGSD